MRPFEFVRARSVSDALAHLQFDGAKVLAGGTTLVDLMKLGVETPSKVIDISGLPLREISVRNDVLTLGALASNSEVAQHQDVVERAPAIAQSILSGASGQIRNAATIGGNLLQRTRCTYFRSTDWPCNKRAPGTGCSALEGVNRGHAVLGVTPSCMAVNPSDLAVALLALDARIHLVRAEGERQIPIELFFRLPGDTPHIESVVSPGELITRIEVPLTRLSAASRYLKLRGRASYEFASASVASAILMEKGAISEAAVTIGGLGTVPWRSRLAEELLLGRAPTREVLLSYCVELLAGAQATSSNGYKLGLARGAILRQLGEEPL